MCQDLHVYDLTCPLQQYKEVGNSVIPLWDEKSET